jgi:hypothetical protein
VALAAIILAVALAACGASSPSASTTAGGGANASLNSPARQAARLNLAKCLRSHGINVPDSGTTAGAGGGGPGGGGGIFRAFRNLPRAQLQSALSACQKYLKAAAPGLALTPAQRAQRQAQLVKFAQCMRSHGVNIPDPTTGTGGGPGAGGGGFGGTLRNLAATPAGKQAFQACSSLRPRFGPGGGGAPAGGGASGA